MRASRALRLGVALSVLPFLLAAPVEAGGRSHAGIGFKYGHGAGHTRLHYDRGFPGRGYHKFRGGGYYGGYRRHHGRHSGAAHAILGLGLGVVLGHALAQTDDYGRERVVVREAPPAARTAGWYQPPSPPRSDCRQTREYQTRITVGGELVDAYGTACLMPDGAWRFGAPTAVPR